MCYLLSYISCYLLVNGVLLNDIDLNQSSSKTTMSDGNKNRCSEVFKGLYFIPIIDLFNQEIVLIMSQPKDPS